MRRLVVRVAAAIKNKKEARQGRTLSRCAFRFPVIPLRRFDPRSILMPGSSRLLGYTFTQRARVPCILSLYIHQETNSFLFSPSSGDVLKNKVAGERFSLLASWKDGYHRARFFSSSPLQLVSRVPRFPICSPTSRQTRVPPISSF